MKNIIFLNDRNLHFYDFKELKNNYDLRISLVVPNGTPTNLSNESKEYLDEIYELPTPSSKQKFLPFSEDHLYPIIERELHKFKNTWIVTVDELNILTAAALRERYNLPGTAYSIVLNYKNKAIQKETLSKAGICVPKFIPIQRNFNDDKIKIYTHLSQTLKIPFVLKPVDMGGTIGVKIIRTYEDFCEYLVKFDHFSNLIAEEFINERLYHCDFIIQNGKYIFAEASEYLCNGLAFVNGFTHGSLLLTPDNPLRTLIIDFCKEADFFLGLRSGCSHFEVFVTKEKRIIFLEAAARPAGSGVPPVFAKTFDKNYMNAALAAEILENPGNFRNPKEYYFWSCFPRKSGIIKEIKIPLLKSECQIEWYVKVGGTSTSSSSVVERSGMLLAHNSNYKILRDDFYSLRCFNATEVC